MATFNGQTFLEVLRTATLASHSRHPAKIGERHIVSYTFVRKWINLETRPPVQPGYASRILEAAAKLLV
jgi:hypothetical protein